MNLRPRRCGSTSATRVTAGRTAWAPGITHRVQIARAAPARREPYYYLKTPRRADLQLQLCRHTHEAHRARATTPNDTHTKHTVHAIRRQPDVSHNTPHREPGREPYYCLKTPRRAGLQLRTHLAHTTHAGTPATANDTHTKHTVHELRRQPDVSRTTPRRDDLQPGREPYYYLKTPRSAGLQLHTHLAHTAHTGTPATANAAPTADVQYDGLPATLPPLPRRHTAAKLLPPCRFFGCRYRWRVPVTRPMLYLIPTAAAGERL